MQQEVTAKQFRQFMVTIAQAIAGIFVMALGANMTTATGSFTFFPGGPIALVGIGMLAGAGYNHYRTRFKGKSGGRAFAKYMALAAVNGFIAMLLARFLFHR